MAIKIGHVSKPLSSTQLTESVSAFGNFVEQVTALSAPFKTEVEVVRSYLDGMKIKHDGQEYYINQRYCYFGVNSVEPGEKVIIDIRYISKL